MGYMSAYELVTPCCSPPLVLVDQLSCFLHYCTCALLHFTLQNALLLCVDIKMCVQNLDVLSSLIVGDFIHLFRNAFAITGHRHSTESVMRRYVYIVFHDVGLKYNFGLSVPPFV